MLKIQGLKVSYGKVQALKGIDLEVKQGEIVSLIGANGAGKTTTLRTISGLLRPTEGKVDFLGQLISGLEPADIVKGGISHCPEGRMVFPRMTVKENLELGAYISRNSGQLKEDFARIFEFFPILSERLGQSAGTLSGGEQQMLAIGRALMSRPKLLLLDEPSLGLAPFLVDKIFDIIKLINKQGISILLIEQNAFQALGIANRGFVMETGNIVLSGNAQELLNNEHVKKAYLGE